MLVVGVLAAGIDNAAARWRLQREQVRARVTRRQRTVLTVGGILVFALPAGAGPDYLPAYPIGVMQS